MSNHLKSSRTIESTLPRIASVLAVLAASTAGTGLLLWGLETAPVTVDGLVVTAVRVLGALACLWYAAAALVALIILAIEATGSSWNTGRRALLRWAPRAIRRLAGVGMLRK